MKQLRRNILSFDAKELVSLSHTQIGQRIMFTYSAGEGESTERGVLSPFPAVVAVTLRSAGSRGPWPGIVVAGSGGGSRSRSYPGASRPQSKPAVSPARPPIPRRRERVTGGPDPTRT